MLKKNPSIAGKYTHIDGNRVLVVKKTLQCKKKIVDKILFSANILRHYIMFAILY